jgi:hypothetical protein
MINNLAKILFLLFLVVSHKPLSAQFINLQITIEPELSAQVEQVLDFGQVVSNSGVMQIELGDLNTGIFSIRAIRSQSLYIELNHPDFLTRENNPSDQIPLELNVSYNNSGNDNISKSQILADRSGTITIGGSENNSENFWRKLYLYVYGSIDVGNIPNGLYKGDVTLFVSYD